MEYSGGNRFMKKNQKQKISWHSPFKTILLIRIQNWGVGTNLLDDFSIPEE